MSSFDAGARELFSIIVYLCLTQTPVALRAWFIVPHRTMDHVQVGILMFTPYDIIHR